MKKAAIYCCIFLGALLMVVASLKPVCNRIWAWNQLHARGNAWWCKHTTNLGGLTEMAYLDDVAKFVEPKAYKFVDVPDTGRRDVNLYILGDSYTEDVPGGVFAGVHTYTYAHHIKQNTFNLDTARKNILVIEASERLLRERFSHTGILNRFKPANQPMPEPDPKLLLQPPPTTVPGKPAAHVSVDVPVYAMIVNKNLEYLLFDYNFINTVRKFKAGMNYWWFNRASGDVTISENKQHLFYKPTVAPMSFYSVYEPLSDANILEVVNSLNQVRDCYKRCGFAEVYISIIPNTATILQPARYNGLIPRVQQHPGLQVPLLDIYTPLSNAPNKPSLFQQGDTHWNNNGMQLWLHLVNRELVRLNYQ